MFIILARPGAMDGDVDGVAFKDGRGETSDEKTADAFRAQGYTVVEKSDEEKPKAKHAKPDSGD